MNIPTQAFYSTYHGHEVKYLSALVKKLRTGSYNRRRIVWLMGDSSLDSKYWFNDVGNAHNGYQDILQPPYMKQDLTYWLNRLLEEQAQFYGQKEHNIVVINCAVEESTICERESNGLYPQDKFVATHMEPQDIIVLSLGGNDVALRPSMSTIFNMLKLIYLNNDLRSPNAWGAPHFIDMFGKRTGRLLELILNHSKTPARTVIPCMIYFPDENFNNTWAKLTLSSLKYDSNPELLQTVLTTLYEHATCKIQIPRCKVKPFALFSVLDGKNTYDYCAAVEPSAQGNRKIAEALLPLILE